MYDKGKVSYFTENIHVIYTVMYTLNLYFKEMYLSTKN